MPRRYPSLILDLVAIFGFLGGVLAIFAGIKNHEVLSRNPEGRDVTFLLALGIVLACNAVGIYWRLKTCVILLGLGLLWMGSRTVYELSRDLELLEDQPWVWVVNTGKGLCLVAAGIWLILVHGRARSQAQEEARVKPHAEG